MPVGAKRDRTLYGLASKRGGWHRYTKVRWAVGILFTVGIALLPWTDTLRLDLWSGRNMWLGEEVGLVQALKAFAFPFLAVNVAIILASRFLGRWLCGFVCPIGSMNRLSEWFRWSTRKWAAHVAGPLAILAVSFLLAAVTFSFWIDWRVFVEGSGLAVSISALFLFGTTAFIFGIVQGMGMRFCRDLCPSGVYFAVLGPQSDTTGVEFAHPQACTDCHACENSCPVDLQPREMLGGAPRPSMGLYPEGLSNFANCLRCGDCVAVCEVTSSKDEDVPLRLGWLGGEAKASADAPSAPPSEETPA